MAAFSAACLLLAACGGGDPLERTVSAKSPAALASWRAHVAADSGVEQRQRIEAALQEIRIAVAGEREHRRIKGEPIATGAEAIDLALAERVNGLRVRDLLQLAGELRVRRLSAELAALELAMNQNAQLITRPDDLASRHHLEGLRERQQVRVDKYREDLAAAERDLAPFLQSSGRRLLEVPTAEPETAPQLLKR